MCYSMCVLQYVCLCSVKHHRSTVEKWACVYCIHVNACKCEHVSIWVGVCECECVCERECDVTAVEHVLVFRAVSPE